MPKKVKEEISGLKTKVDTLESRVDTVESKQAEVEKTTAQQGQTIEEIKAVKESKAAAVSGPSTNISVRDRDEGSMAPKDKVKEIQTYLKRAGYYDGKIDGIKGVQTKKAIKAFQSANGLRADGVVGPKTWELLKAQAGGASAASAEGYGERAK
jgi:peptidoglycan hydrolase-like protein with peptidoglycan-binding domain